MCPPAEDLVRLAGLPPPARTRDPLYAGHVALCGWCRGQVDALAAGLAEPDAAGRAAPPRPFRWFALSAAAAALATAVLMYVFAVAPAREAARRQAAALAAANARGRSEVQLERELAAARRRERAIQAAAASPSATPTSGTSTTPTPPRPRPTPGGARFAVVTPTPAPPPRHLVTPRPVPTGRTLVASAGGDGLTVHVPDLSALAPRRGVVRGSDTPERRVTLVGPLGTRVVSARPTLAWQPFPGARGYQVLVADGDDNPVAESGTLGSDVTSWTPSTNLARGKVLVWEVHALDDAGHGLAASAEGLFAVVTDAQAAALGSAASAHGAAALRRVTALLNAGALADAEAVLAPLTADPSLTEDQRTRAAHLLETAKAARRAIGGEDDHNDKSEGAGTPGTGTE
jgi:hypothetical protein